MDEGFVLCVQRLSLNFLTPKNVLIKEKILFQNTQYFAERFVLFLVINGCKYAY